MTTKLEQAARQALEALEKTGIEGTWLLHDEAITSLREVLDHSGEADEMVAEQAEQERKYGELAGTHNWTPPNYTDEQWQKLDQEYRDHVAEQALQKLSDFHQSIEHDGHCSDCSTHNEPAYPNGECDCGGYPAEQEPVAWAHPSGGHLSARYMKEFATGLEKETHTIPLYAAPVRTKNLTDDEIHNLVKQVRFDGMTDKTFQFARAVIAADREKNK